MKRADDYNTRYTKFSLHIEKFLISLILGLTFLLIIGQVLLVIEPVLEVLNDTKQS